MKRQISVRMAVFAILLASIITGTVVGAILLTRQITTSMRILGQPNFLLVREDDPTVEVTSIAWGDFVQDESKNSETILGCKICIKNIGNVPLVVGWNTTDLNRSIWSISATWVTNPFPEDNYNQFRVDPGYINGYMAFELTLINPYAPSGDYSFTLNFNAQQAP